MIRFENFPCDECWCMCSMFGIIVNHSNNECASCSVDLRRCRRVVDISKAPPAFAAGTPAGQASWILSSQSVLLPAKNAESCEAAERFFRYLSQKCYSYCSRPLLGPRVGKKLASTTGQIRGATRLETFLPSSMGSNQSCRSRFTSSLHARAEHQSQYPEPEEYNVGDGWIHDW